MQNALENSLEGVLYFLTCRVGDYAALKRNFALARFAFAFALRFVFCVGVSNARKRRTSSMIPSFSSWISGVSGRGRLVLLYVLVLLAFKFSLLSIEVSKIDWGWRLVSRCWAVNDRFSCWPRQKHRRWS